MVEELGMDFDGLESGIDSTTTEDLKLELHVAVRAIGGLCLGYKSRDVSHLCISNWIV